MRVLVWLVVMLVAVALQSTVIPALALDGLRPDLILVTVVAAALTEGREAGVLCGIIGGLLQDLLSAGTFGVNILTKMLVGLLVGIFERKINKKNLLMPLAAVGAGTVAALLIQVLFFLGYGRTGAVRLAISQFAPVLAYHLILMAPVYLALLWLKRRLDRI